MKGALQDDATDNRTHLSTRVLLYRQGGGLRYQVSRCEVELSTFEQRFKNVLLKRQPDNVAKWGGRQLYQMTRMAQRVFHATQLT